MSVVGVVIAETSAITGAVLSVFVVVSSVVAVVAVVGAESSLLLQEKTVRLKRDMRTIYKSILIFFIYK